LIVSPDSAPHTNPTLCVRHRHLRGEAKFQDLVYDIKLSAQLAFARGQVLPYTYPPTRVVDRKMVQQLLRDRYRPYQSLHDPHLATEQERLAHYRKAVREWADNLADREHAELLDALVTNECWQNGLRQVYAEMRRAPAVPMIAAALRLLDALPLRDYEYEPLRTLDWTMLMLALYFRLAAYAPEAVARLAQGAQLTDKDWALMLDYAVEACPKLLEWAFTWVELFHILSAS